MGSGILVKFLIFALFIVFSFAIYTAVLTFITKLSDESVYLYFKGLFFRALITWLDFF